MPDRAVWMEADCELNFGVLSAQSSRASSMVVFGKTIDGTRRRAARANPDVESIFSKEQSVTFKKVYHTDNEHC